MRSVWKFSIPGRDRDVYPFEEIEMPANARLLHAGLVGSSACLWAEIDEEERARPRKRLIGIIATGAPVPHNGIYVNTLVSPPFVWHIYDLGEAPQ